MVEQPGEPTTVRATQPPKAVLRIVNPVMMALLGSRFHRRLSGALMVLSFTGRKSGRRYSLPVGRHEVDGGLIAVTGARWRHNLRGGVPVTVTLDGRRRWAHADLVEDPDEVARVYGQLLEEVGLRNARRLGLRVSGDRSPTLQELRDGLRGHVVVRIQLDEPAG